MTDPLDLGLTPLQLDALTELINLGVSRAAQSLRDLVGEQVLLSVPSIAILSRTEAAERLGPQAFPLLIGVRQAFNGEISGSALLIFPEANSLELVRAVAGGHLSLEDIVDLEQEAMAEIGNIILNSCMSTIANVLHRNLSMSLPEVVRGTGIDLFELSPRSADDVVLFIRIEFNLKGREIRGYVAVVMDLRSLASLKRLMNELIRQASP